MVRDDIAANRLVAALERFNPGDIDEQHAFQAHGTHLRSDDWFRGGSDGKDE
jgi:hypothetical protein